MPITTLCIYFILLLSVYARKHRKEDKEVQEHLTGLK